LKSKIKDNSKKTVLKYTYYTLFNKLLLFKIHFKRIIDDLDVL